MKQNNLTSSSNKLIFKNTILLYFRLLITISIALYTSRVVLDVLGVDDFGLYNVVGGTVAIFSFFSASLQSATQRFLMFELGKKNTKSYNKIFNANIQIYIIIAVLVFILAETIGLWYFSNKAKIPIESYNTFLAVYQISIISYCVSILRIPYVSGIIAEEKMNFYAYISIFESLVKLFFVVLLVFTTFDKIIFYSSTILLNVILINFIYFFYCNTKKYELYSLDFKFNLVTVKPIVFFSGWRTLGATSQMIEQNGIILLINYFFSASTNASYAIATQVNVAIGNLIHSFQQAYYPQITKRYASGDSEGLQSLILISGKLSFFLICFIALPILLNTEYLLNLWLKDIPFYSVGFTQLIVICSIIEVFSAPLWMLILSTGKIAKYQIYLSFITLILFLVGWILIINGYNPYSILIIKILSSILILIYRFLLLKYYYTIRIKNYLIKSVLIPLSTFLLTFYFIHLLTKTKYDLESLIYSIVLELVFFPIVIYFTLSRSQKIKLKDIILDKIYKNN